MPRKMVNKREKRSHLRFPSDSTAQVSFDKKFKSYIVGLVCNESFSGCSVITLKSNQISDGAKCYVKCGKLAPLEAVIRWINDLDEDAVRIGLEYSDQ